MLQKRSEDRALYLVLCTKRDSQLLHKEEQGLSSSWYLICFKKAQLCICLIMFQTLFFLPQ